MQAEREKVLIIKPGYSETLDPENSGIVSLGDIVRTTPILHLFPREAYHVTWLVDTAGAPLLRGNDMIDLGAEHQCLHAVSFDQRVF